MSEIDISRVLANMRALAAQAEGLKPADIAPTEAGRPDFAAMLQRSLESVSEVQKQAGDLQTAFTAGDSDVSLTQVMVAMQKASVSFEAMTQVRNKLVRAYEDIMKMPI